MQQSQCNIVALRATIRAAKVLREIFNEGSATPSNVLQVAQKIENCPAAPKSAYKNFQEHSRFIQSLEKWPVRPFFLL